MTCDEIESCLKDLFSSFDFDEFRDASNLLNDIKTEIPRYIAQLHSTPNSFWSNVEGAADYDKKLERKARANPQEYSGRSWIGRMTVLK